MTTQPTVEAHIHDSDDSEDIFYYINLTFKKSMFDSLIELTNNFAVSLENLVAK